MFQTLPWREVCVRTRVLLNAFGKSLRQNPCPPETRVLTHASSLRRSLASESVSSESSAAMALFSVEASAAAMTHHHLVALGLLLLGDAIRSKSVLLPSFFFLIIFNLIGQHVHQQRSCHLPLLGMRLTEFRDWRHMSSRTYPSKSKRMYDR